jgi:hypothetical protein
MFVLRFLEASVLACWLGTHAAIILWLVMSVHLASGNSVLFLSFAPWPALYCGAFGFAMHFLRVPHIPIRPTRHFLSSIVVFSCWEQQQEIVSQSGQLQQHLRKFSIHQSTLTGKTTKDNGKPITKGSL